MSLPHKLQMLAAWAMMGKAEEKTYVTYTMANGRHPFPLVGIPYVLEESLSSCRRIILEGDVLDGPARETHRD